MASSLLRWQNKLSKWKTIVVFFCCHFLWVGREIVESRMPEVTSRIPTESRLWPPREMRHHRLRLPNRFWRKKMIPPQTIASQTPRGWHGARSNQSVKALHPHLPKRRRSARDQSPGGRLRSRHSNRVRVPRLSMARLSSMFPSQTWQICHLPRWLYPARSLWSHAQETQCFRATRLPSPGQVGVRLDQEVKSNANSSSTGLKSLTHCNPETPSSVDAQTPSNFIRWLTSRKEKRSNTWTWRPCTPGNKTQEYPVGNPQVLVNLKDQDIHHYFGEALVDILPPHHLYHTVLPFCYTKANSPSHSDSLGWKEQVTKPLLEKYHHCPYTPE